jgi:hypothetical protein
MHQKLYQKPLKGRHNTLDARCRREDKNMLKKYGA